MKSVARVEREISAQSSPVSGMDRTASRTMGPHHFSWAIRHQCCDPSVTAPKKNRDPHRRWRGRFAVLDPARSTPGRALVLNDEEAKMTLDEHIRELEAELSWNDDPKERAQIMDEYQACLWLEILIEWKAQAVESKTEPAS